MVNVDIRWSTLKDVRDLAPTIREKDRNELMYLGYQPHKALYYSYKHGLYRKSGFVNNKITAMWGVAGSPMGLIGQPYLITGTALQDIPPIRFAKIYQNEVKVMLQIFPTLENYVDSNYHESIKMLRLIGFTVEDPVPFGPNKALFCKFSISEGSV